MYLSDKEIAEIRDRLAKIDKVERQGANKNYLTNQTRIIRLMLNRAERREKNKLL